MPLDSYLSKFFASPEKPVSLDQSTVMETPRDQIRKPWTHDARQLTDSASKSLTSATRKRNVSPMDRGDTIFPNLSGCKSSGPGVYTQEQAVIQSEDKKENNSQESSWLHQMEKRLDETTLELAVKETKIESLDVTEKAIKEVTTTNEATPKNGTERKKMTSQTEKVSHWKGKGMERIGSSAMKPFKENKSPFSARAASESWVRQRQSPKALPDLPPPSPSPFGTIGARQTNAPSTNSPYSLPRRRAVTNSYSSSVYSSDVTQMTPDTQSSMPISSPMQRLNELMANSPGETKEQMPAVGPEIPINPTVPMFETMHRHHQHAAHSGQPWSSPFSMGMPTRSSPMRWGQMQGAPDLSLVNQKFGSPSMEQLSQQQYRQQYQQQFQQQAAQTFSSPIGQPFAKLLPQEQGSQKTVQKQVGQEQTSGEQANRQTAHSDTDARDPDYYEGVSQIQGSTVDSERKVWPREKWAALTRQAKERNERRASLDMEQQKQQEEQQRAQLEQQQQQQQQQQRQAHMKLQIPDVSEENQMFMNQMNTGFQASSQPDLSGMFGGQSFQMLPQMMANYQSHQPSLEGYNLQQQQQQMSFPLSGNGFQPSGPFGSAFPQHVGWQNLSNTYGFNSGANAWGMPGMGYSGEWLGPGSLGGPLYRPGMVPKLPLPNTTEANMLFPPLEGNMNEGQPGGIQYPLYTPHPPDPSTLPPSPEQKASSLELLPPTISIEDNDSSLKSKKSETFPTSPLLDRALFVIEESEAEDTNPTPRQTGRTLAQRRFQRTPSRLDIVEPPNKREILPIRQVSRAFPAPPVGQPARQKSVQVKVRDAAEGNLADEEVLVKEKVTFNDKGKGKEVTSETRENEQTATMDKDSDGSHYSTDDVQIPYSPCPAVEFKCIVTSHDGLKHEDSKEKSEEANEPLIPGLEVPSNRVPHIVGPLGTAEELVPHSARVEPLNIGQHQGFSGDFELKDTVNDCEDVGERIQENNNIDIGANILQGYTDWKESQTTQVVIKPDNNNNDDNDNVKDEDNRANKREPNLPMGVNKSLPFTPLTPFFDEKAKGPPAEFGWAEHDEIRAESHRCNEAGHVVLNERPVTTLYLYQDNDDPNLKSHSPVSKPGSSKRNSGSYTSPVKENHQEDFKTPSSKKSGFGDLRIGKQRSLEKTHSTLQKNARPDDNKSGKSGKGDKKKESPVKQGKKFAFMDAMRKMARGVHDLATGNKQHTESQVKTMHISLDSREQSLLYCELEYHLTCAVHGYITTQFNHGRLDTSKLKRIAEEWGIKGYPRVVGFRYDLDTQLALVAAHDAEFRFYGRRQANIMEIKTLLGAMRTNARQMAVRTFCMPDVVIAKQILDSQSLFNMLGVPETQHMALLQIASFFRAVVERESKKRKEAERTGMQTPMIGPGPESKFPMGGEVRSDMPPIYGHGEDEIKKDPHAIEEKK